MSVFADGIYFNKASLVLTGQGIDLQSRSGESLDCFQRHRVGQEQLVHPGQDHQLLLPGHQDSIARLVYHVTVSLPCHRKFTPDRMVSSSYQNIKTASHDLFTMSL
jgi:hypothetical protein